MFWISILLALVIGLVFILLVKLQWKAMQNDIEDSTLGLFTSSEIKMYTTVSYSPNLRFLDGFSNIAANIILKFVVFLVISVIVHLTKFSILSTVYGIVYLSLEIFKLSTRIREYKMCRPRNRNERSIDSHSKTAYLFLFLYTTVLVVLMYTVA